MNITKKDYINIFAMIFIAIIIGLMPSFAQISDVGMKVLGVFISVLYGWIFVGLFLPSLWGFIALGFTGYTTVIGAFASGFGNQSWLMVMIVMVISGAMQESKLTNFIADWFLKKDFFRKNPWRLVCGFVLLAFILGACGGGLAVTFLLWAIICTIADDCNMEKRNKAVAFLLFLVNIAVSNGVCMIPFQTGALIYGGFFTQATGIALPFAQFMIYGAVIFGLPLVLVLLIARYVLKIDVSQFEMSDKLKAELDSRTSTKAQRVSFYILVIYALALLLPGVFPKIPGMIFLKKLGIVGISAITVFVMALIKVDGKTLIDAEEVFTKHINWTLLLLLAVTFPLADALKSPDTGIMASISAWATPILSNFGLVPFIIFSIIILGLLTQVSHNVVLGAMFIPFLCPLCESLGGNIIAYWFMIYAVLNAAFVTPAASMQSAMYFGHERAIVGDGYKLGIIYLIVTFAVLFVVGIPLGNIVF